MESRILGPLEVVSGHAPVPSRRRPPAGTTRDPAIRVC